MANPQTPEPEAQQGWTQLTDRGRISLARREKNVFVLEGAAAGVAACEYAGAGPERAAQTSGAPWSLLVECKAEGGAAQVLVLFDVRACGDLTSGCDFAAVKLDYERRELRVETYRPAPKAGPTTVYSLPNCAALKKDQYAVLVLTYEHPDSLSLKLNGVPLVGNLSLGRVTAEDAPARRVGIAVYGKARCSVRRFKIAPASEEPRERAPARAEPRRARSPAAYGASPKGGAIVPYEPPATQRGSRERAPTPGRLPPNVPTGQVGEELDLVSMIERDIVLHGLSVTFEEIGGLEDAKRAVNEAVTLPLLLPEMFTGLRKPWRGVLLFGPPGTGKTMLAKAVATAAEGVTFFNCSCATLTSKWRGESEKLLRALFTTARARAPSILFFDEVDSLISQRGSTAEHEASRRFKSEFLIHMDGLLSEHDEDKGQHVLVMATTNTPWDIDDALRRRLEKRIYVPLPDVAARTVMFTQRLDGVEVAPDVDCRELAAWTQGYSGSDIHALCRDAAMAPLRRALDGKTPAEIKALRGSGGAITAPVERADLEAAMRTIAPSVAASDIAKYELWDTELGTK